MSYSTSSMQKAIDHLIEGYRLAFQEQMENEMYRIVNKFKTEELPKQMAHLSRMIEVQMIKSDFGRGLEVRFIIHTDTHS